MADAEPPATRLRPVGLAQRLGLPLAGIVVLIVAAIPIALAAADLGLLNGFVSSAFAAKTHRSLHFQRLTPHLFNLRPSIDLEGLVIGSPSAITREDLARIGRGHLELELGPLLIGRIVPTLIEVSDVDLHLVRLGHGRNNYSFGGSGMSPFLHATRRLSLKNGKVSYEDPERKLTLQATASFDPNNVARPLALNGGGVLSDEPYRVTARGGALNERAPHAPYAFDADLQDGELALHASGTSQAPFDFRGFDLALTTAGPNLGDLAYVFKIDTPNSPPFALSAQASRAGHVVSLHQLRAKIGGSDLAGDLTSDHSHPQRLLRARLSSHLVRAEDLAVLMAARPAHGETRIKPGALSGKTSSDPFSHRSIPVGGLRSIDLDFDLRTEQLTGYLLPLSNVSGHLDLHQGQLEARGLHAQLNPGEGRASLRIDVRGPVPKGELSVDLNGVRLSALRPSLNATVDGPLDARLRVSGEGQSMQAIIGHAKGALSARVAGGALQKSKAEALGGDPLLAAWQGLGDASSVTPLNCARVSFSIRGGVMNADDLILASALGRTTGAGAIDLGQRKVNLRLTPSASSPSRTRISPPILITGALDHPKVSADVKRAFGHAGIGGIVTVLTTPFRGAPLTNTPPAPCPPL